MKTTNNTQATIEILDGEALDMGGGSFMLIQECDHYGPQRILIQEDDLRRLLAALG
ncbi:hypothetical protein [Caenibius sp. WL]|uniref:hypothetical protein n=1 Tax=Caenibius sp. WL TaxID=2872646 RepID=UPI001C98E694|nr:hypothetical protein [Caenibius sp. WL]QZP08167.1 hypothetical protein K5X80_16290 [Caenibius sp. WL]